jgi:hypothetical protein
MDVGILVNYAEEHYRGNAECEVDVECTCCFPV